MKLTNGEIHAGHQ